MKSFLLDTDICIYALKGRQKVLDRMLSHAPTAIFVSVITEAELRAGAAKSSAAAKTLRAIESFLRPLQLIDFTSEDAIAYGRVRAKLETSGNPIGPLDTLIGAHAVSRGLTLVTNNEREFSRIAGLPIDNWTF